jgi:hypothetical protein
MAAVRQTCRRRLLHLLASTVEGWDGGILVQTSGEMQHNRCWMATCAEWETEEPLTLQEGKSPNQPVDLQTVPDL